jgi:ParB family chromosome partitioning protein
MAVRRTRRRKAEPKPAGLAPEQTSQGSAPAEVAELERLIGEAGGQHLARYRDPWGGSWLVLAALPLASIEPTPFQRDLSQTHARRLERGIQGVGMFLDPIVAVPAAPASGSVRFWTPNGLHRLSALRGLGARSVTALVSPDPALAYRILALNTEKAHNVRERALEAVRMARSLAQLDPGRTESHYALELEEGALVTLGCAYERRPRFAGGAWSPALRASDHWLEQPMAQALAVREGYARRLLALDETVSELIRDLRERGFESPYLRNFVVARLRPFRRRGQEAPPMDALFDHMQKAAAKFDVGKVREQQITRAGGAPED